MYFSVSYTPCRAMHEHDIKNEQKLNIFKIDSGS